MLMRLITVITLIIFLLLMISGVNIDVALYRSILVFMVLFGVVYLAIFLLNVIKDNKDNDQMGIPNGSQPDHNQD